MVYDSQLSELKNLLPTAKNILIALPAGSDLDKLAAGLALYLSLKQQGKEVSVVCDNTIRVSDSHLFAIDKVQNTLPQGGGSDFILTLEGVAVPDSTNPTGWKVPSLSTMDYVAQNNNLDLIFHILPGQTFQPTRIVPRTQGDNFNLIFVLGAAGLTHLGNIYNSNQQAFSGVHTVNIDNQAANTGFGQTNIIDPNASCVSEMLVNILPGLGLPMTQDEASNLLAGIFEATNNLTNEKSNADTFMAVAQLLRVGGKKPSVVNSTVTSQPTQGFDLSALIPQQSQQSVDQFSPSQTQPAPQESFVNPTIVSEQPQQSQPRPSHEERPSGERVVSESEVEPDWLTPKIFKGGSAG